MSVEFDVAIVGYGPVGATLANLLGQAGLSAVVLEREPSVYHQPRAAHFDGEVMRVFQSIGLARDIATETVISPRIRFINAEGRLLLDWPRLSEIGPQGWHEAYRFYQPHAERMLREGVARYARVDVRLRCDVLAVEDQGDHVLLKYQDPAGSALEATAAYAVGCDGARSVVRRCMGTEQEDLHSHERWLVLDIILKRLKPELTDITTQICDPARPTTMVRMVGLRRRWELMLMPGDDAEAIARPEKVWELLSRWLKPDEADIERAVVYTFHSVIANSWRSGRMLLAGDACHQTPPFMGQGMCSGIRDAANLAWKLARVAGGRAPEALLDSYQSERSAHVREYIETAVRLGHIIQTTDPEVAARRDAEMLKNPPKMESLKPRLGPGLHGNFPPPSGTLSIQPRLADGRRLDDVAGPRFAILGNPALLGEASAAAMRRWRQADAAVIADDGEEVRAYLQELAAGAVVIRPDRYILGTASTRAELDAVTALIP